MNLPDRLLKRQAPAVNFPQSKPTPVIYSPEPRVRIGKRLLMIRSLGVKSGMSGVVLLRTGSPVRSVLKSGVKVAAGTGYRVSRVAERQIVKLVEAPVYPVVLEFFANFGRFPADIGVDGAVNCSWGVSGAVGVTWTLVILFGGVEVFNEEIVPVNGFVEGTVDYTPVGTGVITCTATLFRNGVEKGFSERTFE